MSEKVALIRVDKKGGLAKLAPRTTLAALLETIRKEAQQNLNDGLFKAVLKQDRDGVDKALGEGADIDFQGSSGLTPLMWACQSGFIGMVELLLERGADKDRTDVFGRTALDFATGEKHHDIVGLLQARGARSGMDIM